MDRSTDATDVQPRWATPTRRTLTDATVTALAALSGEQPETVRLIVEEAADPDTGIVGHRDWVASAPLAVIAAWVGEVAAMSRPYPATTPASLADRCWECGTEIAPGSGVLDVMGWAHRSCIGG